MKIEVSSKREVVLEEIYNNIILRTQEGNELMVYMRDDTIEMSVSGSERWFRVDMKTGDIGEM